MKYLKKFKIFESTSGDYSEINQEEWWTHAKSKIDIQVDSIKSLLNLSNKKFKVRLIDPTHKALRDYIDINIGIGGECDLDLFVGWDSVSIFECLDEWFLVGILDTKVSKIGSIISVGQESFYKCDQMQGVLSLLKDLYPDHI